MSIKKLNLITAMSDMEVKIERKDVKKIRLKVFPNGVIKLSAPFGVSDAWINDYLMSKAKWIEKTLQRFHETAAIELETRINNGISTRILGRQIRIIVKEAKIYRIEQKGDHIYIESPKVNDEVALFKQFNRWWQKQSKSYFLKVIDRLYPVIAKHGIDKPTLNVRKMKTLWGSCSVKKNKINLNYYLYKAPAPCIDYVVLHELTHLLYPKHNKDFYEFLTVHMPDWKERKKILDYEIVKGLRY